jgi:hypothetical protein
MRDNIHTWSLDDAERLHYLCLGYTKQCGMYRTCNEIDSAELCIIYVLDYLCMTDIHKHLCDNKYRIVLYAYAHGILRLLRRKLFQNYHDPRFGLKYHDDTIMYFIKIKRFGRIHEYSTKWYLYDEHDTQYYIARFRIKYSNLIQCYRVHDFDTANKICDKIITTHEPSEVLNYVYRHRDLYVHVHNDDFNGFCKVFRDNNFKYSDIMRMLMTGYASLFHMPYSKSFMRKLKNYSKNADLNV